VRRYRSYRCGVLSTQQFERDLADLTPGQFEQLTHVVVLQEHPNAQKLKAPDFGADVLDDPTSKRPRVWQVKHYVGPGEINWTQCEESLDRAVVKWRPREVTFVFPRDLTGKGQQDFNRRLVQGRSITVTNWTASRLNAELERYPAIRRSFFPHRTDQLHEVLRAARLSEKPADGVAFLEHGLDLAKLAAELDPHFDYELRSRPEHLPSVSWDPAPFMSVAARGGGKESVIAAYAKPGTDAAAVTWSFTEDDAGEEARHRVYRALARGESVELTEGMMVHADPLPVAMRAIIERVGPLTETNRVLRLAPAEAVGSITVTMEGASPLSPALEFPMRAAPPKPGEDAALVGLTSGVLLYVGFEQTAPNAGTLHISPTMDLTASAAENAAAVATMLDLLTHALRVQGPMVGEDAELDLRPDTDPDLLGRLDALAEVYGAVIEIESRTGTQIRVPEVVTRDDANGAINLAALLRQRRTSGQSSLKTTLHVAAQQAAALAGRLADTCQITVPFEQDLMAKSVRFGWARLTFERVQVAAQPPDANGIVGLRIEADGEIELQLIEEPLPTDVALDLATGKWRSAVLS
jgi:hypothetical protein